MDFIWGRSFSNAHPCSKLLLSLYIILPLITWKAHQLKCILDFLSRKILHAQTLNKHLTNEASQVNAFKLTLHLIGRINNKSVRLAVNNPNGHSEKKVDKKTPSKRVLWVEWVKYKKQLILCTAELMVVVLLQQTHTARSSLSLLTILSLAHSTAQAAEHYIRSLTCLSPSNCLTRLPFTCIHTLTHTQTHNLSLTKWRIGQMTKT